jgi:hypothetical protein
MADVGMCVDYDYTVGGRSPAMSCSVTWEEFAYGTPAGMTTSMYAPTLNRWEFRSQRGGLMDARFSRELAPDTAWSRITIAPAFAQEMIYQSFREVEVEVTDDGHAHLWFVRIGSFGRTLERSAQRLDHPQLEAQKKKVSTKCQTTMVVK